MKSRPYRLPARQQGTVLFIALVVLLVVTMLAVTSMRGVMLEARVTGNLFEQKRLLSAAESALRESEKRIGQHRKPLDMCDSSSTPCIEELATTYSYDDFSADAVAYTGIDGNTTLERDAFWYIRDTGIIGSTDPECFLTGKNCVSYYEVNSQATTDSNPDEECDSADALCIRSVVAALYD